MKYRTQETNMKRSEKMNAHSHIVISTFIVYMYCDLTIDIDRHTPICVRQMSRWFNYSKWLMNTSFKGLFGRGHTLRGPLHLEDLRKEDRLCFWMAPVGFLLQATKLVQKCFRRDVITQILFFLGVGEKNLEEKKRHVLKNPIRTHRKMKSWTLKTTFKHSAS